VVWGGVMVWYHTDVVDGVVSKSEQKIFFDLISATVKKYDPHAGGSQHHFNKQEYLIINLT
jgi:hypothetical protein